MRDVALAFRNLFRHRVRSAVALSAIVFGVAALVVSGGFIDWIFLTLREATIQSRLGHIQVARTHWFEGGAADPFAFLLPASGDVPARLAKTPHVRILTSRLTFGGLASHGETSVSFLGEGVEPEKERFVSQMLTVTAGRNLSSRDPHGVIVGEGLAANLGVVPGDPIVLLAATASGGMNAVEGHVRGVFSTFTKAFDDAALRVPMPMARDLLRTPGSHTWVVLLDETSRTPELLRSFRARFPEEKEGLQFRPWNEMADFYTKTVRLFSRQMGAVNFIIALIIVLSISNTLTKSVLERTGEIGTLMATGTRRRAILRLFLLEGLALGIVGGAAGLGIGAALAHLISAVGIPMPPPPGSTRGYDGEVLVSAPLLVKTFFVAVATSLLASLYPAFKASRLNIVDALRHSR